ncbi:MAG: hypothetical protein JO288_00470 [Hyphomicrobiales bacterium]|nr:hypothetical protein [Hyphomicrobiales bacterium]
MTDILGSPVIVATIVVGIAISVIYLRYMWLALRQASATRDDPDDGRADAFAYSFAGAVFAVIASALAIGLYGSGPVFLYLGPLLALASPIAACYAFYRELED